MNSAFRPKPGSGRHRPFPRLTARWAVVITLLLTTAGLAPTGAAAESAVGSLYAGQALVAGETLASPNGRYLAAVQGDGNFVVYGPSGVAFATGTAGAAALLAMQTDGNLVLYAGGRAVFATNTSGGGGFVAMQDDGNLVVYAGGRAAWSIRTGVIAPPPAGPPALIAGQSLTAGQVLVSPNRQYLAAVQNDGNFVIYGPAGVVFATRTSGGGALLAMQGDGNLVLYAAGRVVFATGTAGGGAQAALQDDGNFVVYAGGRAAWSIRTGLIAPPAPPAPPVTGPPSLENGQSIRVGQPLISADGRYLAAVQDDGNFVVYGPGGVVFATGTSGGNGLLAMQTDGNLVLYAGGRPVFATGSSGASPRAVLQNDGNFVVYAGGRAAWSIRTGLLPYPSFGGTGTYRVNVDIAPGTYRTRTDAAGCYWERQSGFSGSLDDIITNDISDFRNVVTIRPSDAGFESNRCGTWTQDLRAVTASPAAPFGDGKYIVGTDISAGVWRASSGASCYWERLSDFTGDFEAIIANDFGGSTIVTISGSDAGFTASRCGTWTKIG